MSEKYIADTIGEGNVKIADDVIGAIAVVAAQSIDGIVGMQGNLKASVTDILGVKNLSKGVKVSVGEEETVINLYVSVLYGRNIVDVCKAVQKKVKEEVENMTSLNVVEVNVHVSSIAMETK